MTEASNSTEQASGTESERPRTARKHKNPGYFECPYVNLIPAVCLYSFRCSCWLSSGILSVGLKAIDAIQWAISEWESKTCIQFARLSLADNDLNSKPHLKITSNKLCHSQIGLQVKAGPQILSLGPGCEEAGIALHEFGHAIGLYHEHNREDRDQYIDIIWENIDSEHKDQFKKYSSGLVDNFGLPYNLHSVMHFSAHTFSANGNVTITSKSGSRDIGNAGTLTQLDWTFDNDMLKLEANVDDLILFIFRDVNCSSIDTCFNGGIFNYDTCQCSCLPYWTNVSCQTCGLVCENGGTPNDDCTECVCPVGYGGTFCKECLFSCFNGGQPNDDCTACKNCSTDHLSQAVVDHSLYCKLWSFQGYCNPSHYFYATMRQQCHKTCNCGICRDMAKSSVCKEFKKQGLCSTQGMFADYMKKECIMTCGWC
ncbi:zinc metalloproteinase nas-13-like [Corticium candelabrum]|uniref:zinc metalloproteinase nas-13-like n=1 Tax=Corticium candelabrum TaxID=121492 RepID=UPI002E26BC58|nr:zinc metalloproteinase nas-13-like [Corticium candelabrum]